MTSVCRELGSNGQAFIFVNKSDKTGIRHQNLSCPGMLHAGCHSPMCLGAPLVQLSVIATEFRFGQTDTFLLWFARVVIFCMSRCNLVAFGLLARAVHGNQTSGDEICVLRAYPVHCGGLRSSGQSRNAHAFLSYFHTATLVSCSRGDGGNGHISGIPLVYQFVFPNPQSLV